MQRLLRATSLVCAALLPAALGSAATARAQTASSIADGFVGKQAGSFMVRFRAIGVIPQDNRSSTSVGGSIKTTAQPAPEVDVSYFFTDNIAAELIAATTRHSIAAVNTAVGRVPVGAAWVLPPTLTAQWHFFPHERFSPYIGAGINASLFYSSQAAGPTVTSLKLTNSIGPAVQIGFDYNVSDRWFLNVDAKEIFLTTKARLNTVLGRVSAKTSLDPFVIGAGVGYRF
jgi:outer membrane protein